MWRMTHNRRPDNEPSNERRDNDLTRPGRARHLDGDVLSAYVDRVVSAVERVEIDIHLAGCVECRHELAELRATLDLLAGLPQYRSRRTFQLGPEHIRPRQSAWAGRLIPILPVLRAAVLVVALLLGGVSAADILTSEEDQTANAPESLQLPVVEEDLTEADGTIPADQSSNVVEAAPPNSRAAAPGAAGETVQGGEGQAGGMEPASDAVNALAPTNDLSLAPAEAEAPTPVEDPGSTAGAEDSPADQKTSWWRIAEVALALLLAWLLILWAAIRSITRRTRGSAALT